MARRCDITGKGGLNGCRVSHANNHSKHVQQPNLQRRRLYVPELGRRVRVRLSTQALRTMDRKGVYATLKEAGLI